MFGALDVATTRLAQSYPLVKREASRNGPASTALVDLPIMHLITHELRSPVQVTCSLLNVLSRGYVGELNAKQADLVDRACRRLQLLETLIDDLLDLAAGKAGAPAGAEYGPVSMSELVQEVCARYEALAGEKGLSVRCECLDNGLMVCGDKEELDRIISNLVSNAVKYTQMGGVEVCVERAGDWIRVTVADTGIGIPEDAQPRLFQAFFRSRNAKALQERGTGLGLVIVKDLVECYGGRIEVESVEGMGTTFTVLLPPA